MLELNDIRTSFLRKGGTGIPDGCDILFMPNVGEPQLFAKNCDKSVN